MSTPNDYTKRELELMFQRLEEMLKDINSSLKENNTRLDGEIKEMREEIQAIKDWQNRLMAIWGVVVFIFATVSQHIFRLFSS